MSVIMEKDDSVLSNRVVPFRLFLSNGTAPDTGASNKTLMFSQAGRPQQSAGSVSAISANAGMYYGVLSQSAISVLGPLALWFDQGDFPQHVANVQVVNYNPYSSLSNIAPKTYSGVTFETSNIKPGTYSGVTVGIDNIKAASYSGVSVGALDIRPAAYSGVTLGVDNIKPAVYSGVSVEVKAGGIQVASLGVGNYSGVSVGALDIKPAAYSGVTVGVDNVKPASYSGVSVGVLDIKPAIYSGVTVEVSNIKPAAYSGVTVGVGDIKPGVYSGVSIEVKSGGMQASSFGPSAVDAAALATDAGQELADRYLLRNIAGGSDSGRSVSEALFALRNRTQLSNLSYLVYQNDDATVAWLASVSTVDSTVRVTDADPV